jgi:hypothetical protein
MESIIRLYWKPSFYTLYDSYFQELLASAVSDRLQRLDIATNLLVTFTASGSAAAGWALWSQVGWRTVWLMVAGVASTASILHGVLTVPALIKKQEEVRQQFARLRIDLETFRYELEIIMGDPTRVSAGYEEVDKAYKQLRDRYATYSTQPSRNIANTAKLRDRIQKDVDKLLEGETRGN